MKAGPRKLHTLAGGMAWASAAETEGAALGEELGMGALADMCTAVFRGEFRLTYI